MTDLSRDDVQGRTLTAFFDTRGAAEQTVSDLEAAGIPRRQIHCVNGAAAAGESTAAGSGGTGFFAALKDMFMPEEDRYGYAEGLQRGGHLVSVTTDAADFARVTDILDRDGAIDMDEREATWRREGWTGYQADRSPASATAAAGTASALGAGVAATAGYGSAATRDEVIPVYEERLTVGKRDVGHGRVRLRSYVVETPVEERVALRREHVEVDRRPVDRSVAAGEAVFQDRVIEADEYAEEAVVSKEIRIKEEVGLRKVADERIETVSDTVRHTEIAVEDDRTTGGRASATGRSGAEIRNDMEVVGSDGQHVGTVDHMDGGRIKLKKTDPAAGGQHHYLTRDMVGSVGGKVMLAMTAAEARARWATA